MTTDLLPPGRRVLAIVAHPDDESFGLGGIIAAFVHSGVPVDVLCFTHGKASTLGRQDGRDWRPVGALPGPPEAVATGPEGSLLAAVAEVGLLRSEDGGQSWQLIYDAAGA